MNFFALIPREVPKRKANQLTLKYYFRLKQCPCHPTGDSQQFPLADKYPDDGGFAEFRQVDCSAVADPGGTFWRCDHGRKFR